MEKMIDFIDSDGFEVLIRKSNITSLESNKWSNKDENYCAVKMIGGLSYRTSESISSLRKRWDL